MRQSRSRIGSSRFFRRSVIRASAGLAGATAMSVPVSGATGAQGTLVASPGVPEGPIAARWSIRTELEAVIVDAEANQ